MKENHTENNNPLNLPVRCWWWRGQDRLEEGTELCHFTTLAYGYRAAWIHLSNLLLWIAQHGKVFSLKNLIAEWEKIGKDHRSVTRQVARLAQVDPEVPLWSPILDYETCSRILAAMTCVAQGISYEEVPWDEIREGYRLAFGKGSPLAPQGGKEPPSPPGGNLF